MIAMSHLTTRRANDLLKMRGEAQVHRQPADRRLPLAAIRLPRVRTAGKHTGIPRKVLEIAKNPGKEKINPNILCSIFAI